MGGGKPWIVSLVSLASAAMASSQTCPSTASDLNGVVQAAQSCSGLDCTQLCLESSYRAFLTCNETLTELSSSTGASEISCETPFQSCESESLGYMLSEFCTAQVLAPIPVTPNTRCANSELDQFLGSIDASPVSGESGIDCGGFWCDRCSVGKACKFDMDCEEGFWCENSVCTTSTTQVEDELRAFPAVSVIILVVLAVLTVLSMKVAERRERERRERDKRQEMKEALLREKESRKTRMTTSATKFSMPSRMVGLKTASKSTTIESPSDGSQVSPDPKGRPSMTQYKTLEQVLADPVSKRKFYTFCKTKVAHENLLFWESVNEYEKMWEDDGQDAKEIQKRGRKIVEKYINDVNIGSSCRCEIMAIYENSDPSGENQVFAKGTFTEAKNEVFTLMNNNFFSDFVIQDSSGLILDRSHSFLQVVAT